MVRELQAAASCWESLSTLEDQVLDPEAAKQRIAEITQQAKAYAKEVWANADPDDEWGPQRAVSNYWKAANKEMSEIHGHAQILPKILEALRGTQAMWRFNNWGYQFQLHEGCMLQWWPTTCGYLWQGKGMKQGLSKEGDKGLVESVQKHVRQMRTPNKRSKRKPAKRRRGGWSYTVEDLNGL